MADRFNYSDEGSSVAAATVRVGSREPLLEVPRESGCSRRRLRLPALILAAALPLLTLSKTRGEDQAVYRYESYAEDHGRISIATHSALFEKKLSNVLSVKGEYVYDSISGATPSGGPTVDQIKNRDPFSFPATATGSVVGMKTLLNGDIRRAGSGELGIKLGNHRFAPQFSYSEESDYLSRGYGLNYSWDFNEKNTTLNAGWAHTYDSIPSSPGFMARFKDTQHKTADDFFVGVNQLLGPKTVLTFNVSYGNSYGYLSDPYKGVLFQDYQQSNVDPNLFTLEEDTRPRHKHKYVGYTSLTQYITPLHASVEGSYRLYYDSFGILAHTIGVSWHQKVGKFLTLSPSFRFYHQSAADFYYANGVPGDLSLYNADPTIPIFGGPNDGLPNPAPPAAYSSDYRLSEMNSYTYGIHALVKLHEHFGIDLGYQRYSMEGLDGVTSVSAYPEAHIVTLGARVWF